MRRRKRRPARTARRAGDHEKGKMTGETISNLTERIIQARREAALTRATAEVAKDRLDALEKLYDARGRKPNA